MIKILYKRTSVKIPDFNRPIFCQCCLKKPNKSLECHHTKYAYTKKQVKANPKLALENTVFLCYHCHRIANCMRILEENPNKVFKLTELIK